MDHAKCNALKTDLASRPEPLLVGVQQFFDGNDDLGSIGCNLMEHPGVVAFRDVLTGLLRRPDVQAVHARISEVDPGEGSWPFADMVLVTGTITTVALRDAVQTLQPDEVADAAEFGISPDVVNAHGAPVLAVWWD